MLTRVGITFGVVVLVGALAVSAWQHSSPGRAQAVQERAQAVQEWFLYGPAPRGSCVEYTSSVTLDPIAQTCTVGGAPVAVSWGSYAQTQIADGFEASGVVRIFGCEDMPTGFGVPFGNPFQNLQLNLLPGEILIEPVGTSTPGGNLQYNYELRFAVGEDIPGGSIAVPADGQWHEFAWSIKFTGALSTRNGTEPIGEKGVTHAKENYGQDEWFLDDEGNVTLTFGEHEVVYTPSSPMTISTLCGVYASLAFNSLYSGIAGDIDELLQITVNFNAVEIDAGLLDVEIEPATKYGSYTGNNPRLFGEGNTLTWDLPDGWPGTCADANWSGGASAAHHHTFNLDVGVMIPDTPDVLASLLLTTGWQRYSAALTAWENIKQAASAWNAAEYIENYGRYTWDAATPPDGALRFVAPMRIVIDPDSAEEHGLRGIPKADDFELIVSHGITAFQDAKGCYWESGVVNGEPAYTNGHWWIYLHASYGWSIGQSLGSPPHWYSTDGEGPQNTYMTNVDDFDDPSANPDWDQTQIVSVGEPNSAEKAAAAAAIDEFTPSFAHDLTGIIDGWTLAATDREGSPYVNDIASLAHVSSVGILAEDDDLSAFEVVADCTQPSSVGAFDVEATDGSIKYAIPTNWIDRVQTHIPAQDSVGGPAPVGYMTMQHDAYYGHATTPETTREGVYCWKGWRYLYATVTVPAALTTGCDVTCTVRYYGDISVSDNHKTDSTRQTELSVDLGDVTTLTRTVSVTSSGTKTLCFDLAPLDGEANRLPPLMLVTEVEFGFSEAATGFTISEPTLSLDDGDAIAGREAIAPHCEAKHFEHAAYARGGGSGVADGVHLCALYAFDEDSPNTIERTLGNFSRLIGAKTGIDMTSAWSLAQWLSLATASSDAWTGTYNSAAADAAFVDADSTALKAPSVTDLRPFMQQSLDTSSALEVACRVVEWTPVAGLKYQWYCTQRHWGDMQGWATNSEGVVQRSATNLMPIWRRTGEEWEQHDSGPASDNHGRWVAAAGETHDRDDDHFLYFYGIGPTATSVTDTGRWADREWDVEEILISSALGAPWLHWMAGGWLHIAVTIDSIVRYYWVEPFRATPILREADAHPFGEEGGFQNPFITSYACGWLLVGATEEEGYMRLSRSERFGDTWEEVSGGTLVDDLRNGCVDISDGFLIACGWKDGDVLFRTTSGREFTPEAIHYGGPDNSVICESDAVDDDAPRSQVRWRNGAIEAMVETATGANLYRSRDWGTTWTQIEAPHIADGMRGGNLAFIDGELLACGTEEGEVRAETAYRDTRVPESWWWTGPTHLTVVETAIASAIEAVHGERWVATGEDGISLYRLRNPFAGFEKII